MLFSRLRIRRRSALSTTPAQLIAAIFVCVVCPFLVQTATLPQGWQEPEARNTAIATLLAVMGGLWLQRSVTALPGTRESSSIFPSQAISFGIVLTGILFFRIDYSRGILFLGFALTIVWFYLAYLVVQRHTSLVIGTVAGGRIDLLEGLDGLITVPLGLTTEPTAVDAVSADFRFAHSDEWEARIADYVLAGLPVYHAKDLYESLTGRVDLEHLSENTFGALGPLAPFQKAKRVVDSLIAAPVLLLISPVLLIVALAIRLDSPGPSLFRQTRVGYRARPFTVLKFRTMRIQPAADSGAGLDHLMTQKMDGRITRLGSFLRRSRLDELPQVINILRGEMSWIGPRPEALGLSEWYESELPFYRYRHVVVPGITGWAQVSQGHVSALSDVKTKLEYDFYYIRNFSIWLDLLIIAKTGRIMVTGFGAH